MAGRAQNTSHHPACLFPFWARWQRRFAAAGVVPDFRYDEADPLSLAKVTIYVPTRRAARVRGRNS